MSSYDTVGQDRPLASSWAPFSTAETVVHGSLYRFVLDYHPELRARRWVLMVITHDEDRGRDYRCWTLGGAQRLKTRIERRTSRAADRLLA